MVVDACGEMMSNEANNAAFRAFHKEFPREKWGISGVSLSKKDILVLFDTAEDKAKFPDVVEFMGRTVELAVGSFRIL